MLVSAGIEMPVGVLSATVLLLETDLETISLGPEFGKHDKAMLLNDTIALNK